MNKKIKKTFQKESDKERNNQSVHKKKLKNNLEKNLQLPPKSKISTLKISKANEEPKKYNRNIKIHSIS